MRSGKENSARPSFVFLIWSATEASPLMRIVVGPHQWVMVVISNPNDCLVTDM